MVWDCPDFNMKPWVTSDGQESRNKTIDYAVDPHQISQTLMTLDLDVYTDTWGAP